VSRLDPSVNEKILWAFVRKSCFTQLEETARSFKERSHYVGLQLPEGQPGLRTESFHRRDSQL
jgi:hypothetical protein